jgi:hypothetical protein
VWVIDLMSRDGTQVNGQSVHWKRLENGDLLRVGAFEFLIEHDESAPAAPGSWGGRAHDLVASTPHVPDINGPHASLDAVRAMLMPMLHQFNEMQQHMLDQFNQTISLMVRLFMSVHCDQARLVQEQLGELQAINRDLRALREQLSGTMPNQPAGCPDFQFVWSVARDLGPSPFAEETRPIDAAAPDQSVPRSAYGDSVASPTPSTDVPSATDLHASESVMTPDLHVWLSERIVALQTEQHGRLRKLLATLLGK